MKRNVYIALAVIASLAMTSCNEDAQFRGELYKKVIYVLSNTDFTFETEHAFGETSTGYVTIYCGGTEHINKDVTVELEYDNEAVPKYNYINFDLDESRYAHELDPSRYRISSYQVVLKASNPDNYSLLPIEINPDGLSPDSIYFVPLRIKSVSDYEINPNKQYVMYRVLLKNEYATMKTTTYYQVTGVETRGENAAGISVTRIVAPVSKNQIRFFAGTNTYNPSTVTREELAKYAVVATINDDKTVTISSHSGCEVEQLDAPDSNYWEVNARGLYVLHLNYRYKDPQGTWVTMEENCVQRK
ncbi:MAG: DUF4361 domain-containing protein [Muribaculaceae bacterium]|nr:DUF4361 domain-containing protein [Muribaculaceae bacterium]